MVPIRPTFYKRYVGDIYNSRQKNTVDKLYTGLVKYYPKVKSTIETNPLRFLDTKIIHNNSMIETLIHREKNSNYQHHGHLIFLKASNGTPLKQNYIEQSAFHQTLQMR